MLQITSIKEMMSVRKQWAPDLTVGLVPTMGCLHAGHISLVSSSLQQNTLTIVSIYVNPTQFNQSQDLAQYPSTLDDDIALLTKMGVDYLFLPSTPALYADDYHYRIMETTLSRKFEGKARPGHFEGMLTVVMKLLLLVRPQRAYFGEKDYQQLLLVRGMVAAFFIDVEIISCPTVRDDHGLALSSRNSRLNQEQLHKARQISTILRSAVTVTEGRQDLLAAGFEVEYLADYWGRRLGAVCLDGIRLIDNILIEA